MILIKLYKLVFKGKTLENVCIEDKEFHEIQEDDFLDMCEPQIKKFNHFNGASKFKIEGNLKLHQTKLIKEHDFKKEALDKWLSNHVGVIKCYYETDNNALEGIATSSIPEFQEDMRRESILVMVKDNKEN